jgi:glycosyltransferase involved in cell wall biosynthesis
MSCNYGWEMDARVAVIIPCYNDGATLPEAVGSIVEEEPVEVVIVDDGSTDTSTLAILAELESAGYRIIHQANAGLSAARMAGVAATQARFVYPLDADDRLLAGSLAVLADALDACPQAGVAYGDYETFGDYQGRYRPLSTFDAWALTYANFYPVSSLVRRQALVGVGGWELKTGVEDWDLWLKLAETGWGGVYIKRSVYQRRLHGTRMHAQARQRHQQLCQLIAHRHEKLYRQRRQLRQSSSASFLRRIGYPLVFGLRNQGYFPFQLESWLLQKLMERSYRRR